MGAFAKCVAMELKAVNIAVLVVGCLLQGLGFLLLVADPLTDIDGLDEFVEVYKVKMAPFFLGLVLMLAGFIGLKFVANRTCVPAFTYFTLLSIVMAVEMYAAWFAFTSMDELHRVTSFEHGYGDITRRRMMGKLFYSFAKRFNDPERHSCKFIGADGQPLPVQVKDAQNNSRWHAPCQDVKVVCSENQKWTLFMADRCVPKEGAKSHEVFKTECNDCLTNYYDQWIKDSWTEEFRENTTMNMTSLWHSDASLGWCRCYGRSLDSYTRYFSRFKIGSIIAVSLQASLLLFTAYLFCCVNAEDLGESDDEYEVNVNTELSRY